MTGLHALPLFADCPRCGGWARRAAGPRARCRGCGWTGLMGGAGTAGGVHGVRC